jgi:hypothetical protein
MLVQTPQTVPYIGIFKLSSGEEFIGKVIEETHTAYVISKPLCLIPTQAGSQFAPLMMLGDTNNAVSVPKPVIHTTPNDTLAGQYESITTGIALPKKSAIIT